MVDPPYITTSKINIIHFPNRGDKFDVMVVPTIKFVSIT